MPDRTKNHILHAFNRLVQKRNFDKITVDNICQEAEVGRTTFYRYFTDKYDLLDYSMYCTFHEHQNDESIKTFR
ncbi:MAG: TetR/AcrR family transcriptional regulator, partial [Clostridia bacterium]|nr:TetR/AcrR family transcriptional regulator [Clostridia bacterium]